MLDCERGGFLFGVRRVFASERSSGGCLAHARCGKGGSTPLCLFLPLVCARCYVLCRACASVGPDGSYRADRRAPHASLCLSGKFKNAKRLAIRKMGFVLFVLRKLNLVSKFRAGSEMRDDGVLFPAEGAARALGRRMPPLASNFRRNDASTSRAAAIDPAAVERYEVQWPFVPSLNVRAGRVNEWPSRRAAFAGLRLLLDM